MPPQIALLLTIVFCVWMFRNIDRTIPAKSRGLWLVLAWMFFASSRFPAQWLHILGISVYPSGGTMEEGSPVDAVIFLLMIAVGIGVLKKRRINLGEISRGNLLLCIFFVYCVVAIAWSDFPFVAIKRWVKTLGHPVMALVLVTDQDPISAVRSVFYKWGALVLPGSTLFIKYYPEFGRGFDMWTGVATNQGIFLSKNELGAACMISGLFFIWQLSVARKIEPSKDRLKETAITIGFLCMVFWLLRMAQSATSLSCLVVGIATFIGLGFRFVSKRNFGVHLLILLTIAAILETTVGIYKPTLELLGRNANLTDRTDVWADAMKLVDSPLTGAGFESFWLGDRLKTMWNLWWWQPIQAHNGYVETYLNLGLIGVILLVLTIISAFRTITKSFSHEFTFARFRMAILFTVILSNFTEATFRAMSVLWTIFYIIALKYPDNQPPLAAYPTDDVTIYDGPSEAQSG